MNVKGRKGISKAQWLDAALEELAFRSVSAISIEKIARKLGIAKSGFYWHFKDRDDLLSELLAFWTHEMTEVVTDNRELAKLEPKKRLYRTAEMILDNDLIRYEIGIRQWALNDDTAAKAVEAVNNARLKYSKQAFLDYGFSDYEAEVRGMIYCVYASWETPMFRELARKKKLAMAHDRIEILFQK